MGRSGRYGVRLGPTLRAVVLFKERDITVGSRGHRFEVVICDHVLQYYAEADQIAFLDRMTRAVQPGGFLYVSTPSIVIVELIPQKYGFQALARHFYRRV